MKSYTLCKVDGTPDWSKIPTLMIDTPYGNSERFPIISKAQLCWDDEGIHVHLMTVEENIRCVYNGVLDRVWQDSCLEFFFRPTESMAYFNFEFNLNCALYLGYGKNMEELVRLIVQNQQKLFKPCANRTADGWEITYHIPFHFIKRFFPDFDPHEGHRFYGNCYKCGDLAPNSHWFSWSPVTGEHFTFHKPECFGEMILGGAL